MPSMLPRIPIVDPFLVPITPTEQKALTPEQVLLSADAIGMLPNEYSQFLGDPDQLFYFQRDHGKTCLTRYTPRTSPPSEAELAGQLLFAQAVHAWQAMTPEQKEVWNTDPRRHEKRLPGYQFFLSEFMRGRI